MAGTRISDGSAAVAHLYARWEIASAAKPRPADLDLYPPAVVGPGAATLRRGGASDPATRRGRSRHTNPSPRVAAAIVTAAMAAVLAVGVARVWRTPATDVPASITSGPVTGGPVTSGRVTGAAAEVTPGHADATPRRDALATAAAAAPRRLVRAADVGAAPYSPSFAPPTGWLVFPTGQARTGLHEASLPADGTVDEVRTLVRDGARSYHVQMSPDGTQMAFDSHRDGVRGVYVANRDGSHARRVSGRGTALVPSWSPDGSRLAFVRAEAGRPRVWQLWTVALRTNQLRQHTFHHVGQPWGGSWFPDGHVDAGRRLRADDARPVGPLRAGVCLVAEWATCRLPQRAWGRLGDLGGAGRRALTHRRAWAVNTISRHDRAHRSKMRSISLLGEREKVDGR